MFRNSRLFKFLASLKLAVIVITLLIITLVTATTLESVYSTETARRLVYDSTWFSLLLLFLGINVLASALIRFPWKRHQTGFVVTHLGILAILVGSWATRAFGVDAQLSLAEGSEGTQILENRPTFYFQEGERPFLSRPMNFPWFKPSPEHPNVFSPQEGITVSLDHFYPNAVRQTKARPARPEEGAGLPAAHIQLAGSMANQDFWLFLGHPEMDRLMLGPAAVVFQKASHWNPARLAGLGPNQLALLLETNGKPSFLIRHRGQWGIKKELVPGQALETGWGDMKFTLVDLFPQAFLEFGFEPQALQRQQTSRPAIHYRIATAAESKEGWLGWDGSSTVRLGERYFSLAYGEKQWDLPFTLKLEKFHIGMNPGTNQPASFESLVQVGAQGKAPEKPVVIAMNQPLKYGGFVFFQACYDKMENGRYLSVLSVSRDPGVWLKYLGSLVLVLGIAFMFWFKKPLAARDVLQA
jgi:hypothetical protein